MEDPRLEDAKNFLRDLNVPFRQCSPYHLKVRNINFYSNGTCNLDGESKFIDRGWDFWKKLLIKEGLLKEHDTVT